ncbi:dynein intermediate chain 2, ciliary [Tribolium madens]|uniref:dynein intermediate chain 2, ciliary n=1 Tax=Tribolium madens TaxID=41895 RepID=UPI001CF72A59|nr:dynein intermediate chain 2, ciliary [Tribolium madens]
MPPTATIKKVLNTKTLKKGRQSNSRVEDGDDLEEWKKSKQLLRPKDQLELSEGELKDIIARQLGTNDPLIPQNLVQFNYAQGGFELMPPAGPMIVVYEAQGTQIHKESEEAKKQVVEQGLDPSILEISQSTETLQVEEPIPVIPEEVIEIDEEVTAEESERLEEETEAEEGEGDAEGEGEGEGEGESVRPDDEDEKPQTSGKPKKLTNQFNFCERAALTYNNPMRTQETQTIPPPMGTFSANVLQWIIYDAYQEDFEAQQLEKELERERKEKEKAPVSKHAAMVKKLVGKAHQLSEAVQGRVLECWKVLERMVNQNTFDDIAKDYRYWEDPSDEFRDEEGTLLPLWKFHYDKTRKNTVTDIEWNPHYYDLFAVCFGFLDFMKPLEEGAVCLFTLKNPSFPDYICMTDSAVMCVDTHPKYPYMVVIGLYDGSVRVYNVQATCKQPAFRSNNVTNKHRGIVWEVKWAPDLPDGEMNFYSVSEDGKINNWVLMQNDLAVTTIITLFLAKDEVFGPDGTKLKVKGCASCVKFHPKQPLIYLVGTEEGNIYKCSTAYSSMFLLTYEAHHMPVYRIDFNRYNSDIFISCSGDWRIKIWEDNRLEPLFVFDVGACVGDVKWAPYSSTVFAAVTSEGKVYVFDLNVNKYKPICVQAIVSKRRNKLTRISFNPKLPIIIVGDDKGCVQTLKLSPNLRIPCKAPKKQQHLDQWTLQCMKLDKLLSLVREPGALDLPEDTAESIES